MSISYNIDTKSFSDGKILQTVDRVNNGTVEQQIFRQVLDTKDHQIRAALINLGWVPPGGVKIKKALRKFNHHPTGMIESNLGDYYYDTEVDETILAHQASIQDLEARKDGAYFERNQCVALIARMAIVLGYQVSVTKTAIDGWSEDWHGCVYINLPSGQVSWHFHDSQACLFEGLPNMPAVWDGHDTPEKYNRVNNAFKEMVGI